MLYKNDPKYKKKHHKMYNKNQRIIRMVINKRTNFWCCFQLFAHTEEKLNREKRTHTHTHAKKEKMTFDGCKNILRR